MSSLFKRFHGRQPDNEDEVDDTIDPDLRLRTVKTAASVIAESIRSERRAERRKTVRQKGSRLFRGRGSDKKKPTPSIESGRVPGEAQARQHVVRRNVYVNYPLSPGEVDSHGDPLVRYVRNKVRTSKYTILTFVPKNLYEQFRRVANLYFLGLVILQLFPVFGAPTGTVAFLPLLFILTVTAIKDGIEDYRRAKLDEEVNCSAATKLGSWHNVNQPSDPRTWFEKLLRLKQPGTLSRGVRRLREKEASEGISVMLKRSEAVDGDSANESSLSLSGHHGASGRRLDDIQSVDSHAYPPGNSLDGASTRSRTSASTNLATKPSSDSLGDWNQGTLSSFQSNANLSVMDPNRHSSGMARWERTLWKKLEVGDIVLLREDEQVPADIVVLSTSDPDDICYLETKNLDGETNLKPRKAARATAGIATEEDIERSSFHLDSEGPHVNLYQYHGVLRYKDPVTNHEKLEALSINELLLRGCTIRNTSWIIGLVVYTGADTKIMLNGGDTPSKRSKIEKETNFNVIVNFVVLIFMCLFSALFSGLQLGRTDSSEDFFEKDSEPTHSDIVNAIVTFASCLIAFQNIVPISLYISIEIVKTIQAYFISQDIDMYTSLYDTPCVPKTWNISDDLGQIEYIFSDKTGTLTQNVMEFQRCSVRGVIYGEGVTEAQRGAALRQGKDAEMLSSEELSQKLAELKHDMIAKMERTFKNRYLQHDKVTLVSPRLAEDLADKSLDQRGHLIAFFRALALCHGVLADRPEPNTRPHHVIYKAESPDEAALVAAARDAGFPFVGKSKGYLDIEVMGQAERYVPLRVLEFNSTRKRMSVIVRNPEGKIVLYCKGADSVIYERLAKDHDPDLKAATQRDMETFANGGLRTLCVAYRIVGEEEYLRWSTVYDAAASAVEDRDEAIEKANDQIEHSLVVLGATALEDKLQEGVPEAIEMLHQAGIKLWILTGDKLQTAIEIGYSCNLLKSDMDVMILSADSPDSTRAQIEAGLNKIASVLGPPLWDNKKRGFLPGAKASFAAVIDGDTLRHALTPEIKPLFLNLGTQCETVVCCRVSPAQKALTVKLVKEGREAMTLSIGDGANDVAMIQEANIGCGLFGLEGSQASMSADYAFGQFRFLTKLLLVHGRWSYQRVADMHSNFFYKNVIWTFAMFWYLPYNGFDATYLYQYTFILLYNLAFTSLPVIVMGAFDQDINAAAALAFPQLYVRGIRGLEYTRTKFWLYMLDGLYQSAIVFFIPYLVWTIGMPVSSTGKGMEALADFGTTVAVAAIFAANTFVGLNIQYWTIIIWIVVFGSSIIMLAWVVVFSFFDSPDFVHEVVILFGAIIFWTTVVFTILLALAPRFLSKFFTTVYTPLDKDIVREAWVMGDLKDRLGIRHRNARKNKKVDESAYVPILSSRGQSSSEMNLAPSNRNQPRTSGSREVMPYLDTPPESGKLVPPGGSESPPDRSMAPSPQPSYYSASDIRIPSPPPQPLYRYTSGEVTSVAPTPRQSMSRRSAYSVDVTSPGSSRGESSARTTDAGTFEMQIRSPRPKSAVSPAPPSVQASEAGEDLFTTVEGEWTREGRRSEGDDAATIRRQDLDGRGSESECSTYEGGKAI